ncbi:hypothetical protein ACWCPM_18455 [Streptomyces sp. NPDC002309]
MPTGPRPPPLEEAAHPGTGYGPCPPVDVLVAVDDVPARRPPPAARRPPPAARDSRVLWVPGAGHHVTLDALPAEDRATAVGMVTRRAAGR